MSRSVSGWGLGFGAGWRREAGPRAMVEGTHRSSITPEIDGAARTRSAERVLS